MADTKLVKARGEHWVCSVLAGLGWSVALTRDGLERTDILASNVADGWVIEVQVKSASHMPKPNWRSKAQKLARTDREWFVFVALAEDAWGTNRGFVVPRNHVSGAEWIQHQHWLTEPGIPEGKRNTGIEQARLDAETLHGYENRWDLLGRPTSKAPVLLPSEFRTLALDDRVGLPEGHPWQDSLPSW